MATQAAEKVYKKADSEDELDHVTCHCTKYKISFCKLDVSDMAMILDGITPNTCPTCVLIYELSTPACPFGCTCDEECLYIL